MKKSIAIIVLGITLILVSIFFSRIDNSPAEKHEQSNQKGSVPVEDVRSSITFIMGEDTDYQNPYYSKAFEYYMNHPDDKTDLVVSECRTIIEVRDFLEKHRPDNGMSWGIVNLVTHSNEWLGISAPVENGGHRANKLTILEAIENEVLLPLSDSILDEESTVVMESCGLGKDEDMLEMLKYAFGGFDDSAIPQVNASPYFVTYSTKEVEGITTYNRGLTKPWYAFYPTTQKPSPKKLIQQFNNQYPKSKLNWKNALTNEISIKGEAYSKNFVVPVVWDVVYPSKSSRPNLSTEEDQMNWLESQEELMDQITQMGINKDFFKWNIEKVIHYNEDGTWEAAVKATGLCSVVCVLKEIA